MRTVKKSTVERNAMDGMSLRSLQRTSNRFFLFILSTLLVAACGGAQKDTNVSQAGGTGTVSFSAVFEAPTYSRGAISSPANWGPPTTSHLAPAPLSPVIHVCDDYGLGWVDLAVIKRDGQTDSVIQENRSIPCTDNQGTVGNVPAGSGYYFRIEGRALTGGTIWRGYSDNSFAVVAGNNTNVGKISVTYVGNDNIAPTILSVSPADNATHVLDNSTIRIVFSERMAISTVEDDGAIVVSDNIAGLLTGTRRYLDTDNSVTFTPTSPWRQGARVSFTVDNSVVTDMAARKMDIPFMSSFKVHTTGSWFDPVRIDNGSGPGPGQLDLAIDNSGSALAVWSQSDGIQRSIFSNSFSRFAGTGSWSTAAVIERDNSGDANNPRISGDGSGNALAVWEQAFSDITGVFHIVSNEYVVGNGWQNTHLVENDLANSSGGAVVARGPAGGMAVWTNSSGGGAQDNLWAAVFQPTVGWQPASPIEQLTGNSHSPRIAMNSRMNTVIAWEQAGVIYALWKGYIELPGTVTQISTSPFPYSFDPACAIDESGNAIVMWRESEGGSGFKMKASRYDRNLGWDTVPADLGTLAGDTGGGSVVMDGAGNAIAVWYQNLRIYFNRFTPSSRWSGATPLDNNTGLLSSYPSIGMNYDGQATAVWKHKNISDNSISLWARRFSPSTGWHPAVPISDTTTGTQSKVVVDRLGRAVAIWTDFARVWSSWTD